MNPSYQNLPSPRDPGRVLSRLGLFLRAVVFLCTWVVCIVPVTLFVSSYLGRYFYTFDLACHFRVQYVAILTPGTLAFLCLRRWASAAVTGLLVLIGLMSFAPFYHGNPELPPPRAPVCRIVSVNAHKGGRTYRQVRSFLRSASPTVIVLEEVDAEWMDRLLDLMPYWVKEPRSNDFGIAIGSAVPVLGSRRIKEPATDIPSLVAHLSFHGKVFTVVGAHPPPPMDHRRWQARNRQLEQIAKTIKEMDGPVLLAGDLNITPWSPFFSDLLKQSGLGDSRLHNGLQPSWPTVLPPCLRIPLDHCLVSPEVTVIRRRLGPYVGSDHLPVIVDVSLR
ncbi:MAG: endonuclease/exonuclease/phosphatase family protein [Armatimonadetes bacterium]|nr:endonuclease/exonuclease/phosphatase family protein [Armatimonadota bacterium]